MTGPARRHRTPKWTFCQAAVLAARDAMASADPVVLEAVYRLSVTVESSSAGDVMGDLSRRRGRLLASSDEGPLTTITADVPMSEDPRIVKRPDRLRRQVRNTPDRTNHLPGELPPSPTEPGPGGGTSQTREPRRPRPQSGADAISMPRPDRSDDNEPEPADIKRIV